MFDDALEEYEDGFEEFAADEFESEFEYEEEFEAFGDRGGVFTSTEEMELAAELLTVSDDEELEQFLGNLIKTVGKKVGKFAKSSAGRALGGILKGAAKTALPILGGVAGTALGGPAGGAIGSKLASTAGRIFGLELEGLSPEDQEFEVARRVVRFAGEAAKKVAAAPKSAPASKVAKAAATAAAKKHAPGLTNAVRTSTAGGGRRAGRWVRRGRKIIVLGA